MAGAGSTSEKLGKIWNRVGDKTGEQYYSPVRLWVTADGERVVKSDSGEAAFLLVGVGGSMPAALARELGIDTSDSLPSPVASAAVPRTGLTMNTAEKTSSVSVADSKPVGEVPTPAAITSADATPVKAGK